MQVKGEPETRDVRVVGVWYRPSAQEDGVDEAPYSQMVVVSRLPALVLTGVLNHRGIFWRDDDVAGHRPCRRFLECGNDNFLAQVIEEPARTDAMCSPIGGAGGEHDAPRQPWLQ